MATSYVSVFLPAGAWTPFRTVATSLHSFPASQPTACPWPAWSPASAHRWRHRDSASKDHPRWRGERLGTSLELSEPWRCADRSAAARSHRLTSWGELAARTSLRGDVEVVGFLTFPGVAHAPCRPRACLIFYSRARVPTWSTAFGFVWSGA